MDDISEFGMAAGALKELHRPADGSSSAREVSGVPAGAEALVLAALAMRGQDVVFVARDDVTLAETKAALAFVAGDLECLTFPAWDCLPYDRVSPKPEIVGRRLDTLARLSVGGRREGCVVITTVSALMQRVAPASALQASSRSLSIGDSIDTMELTAILQSNGYQPTETVREDGEFALRGGIVDIFPPGAAAPSRLDFFGDVLEGIRTFDPMTQRTIADERAGESLQLNTVSEISLTDESISKFRSAYRVMFGVAGDDDPLYGDISAGQRHIGMEHWLPLFHDHLETLLDYLSDAALVLGHQVDEARAARLDLITEYFAARRDLAAAKSTDGTPYRPVPVDSLFLDAKAWDELMAPKTVLRLTPFSGSGGAMATDLAGRPGQGFADVRVDPNANIFDAVRERIAAQLVAGHRVLITAHTEGSSDRLGGLLREHGVENLVTVKNFNEFLALPAGALGMAILPLAQGIEFPGLCVITEQDILGDRLNRPSRRRLKAENFITETSSLGEGDIVVHADHGIAQFDSLVTIEVGGAPHDCLRLLYAGDDRLFLPVENIEILSRYGSEDAGVQLDKLGGAGWQARKAKLKQRIRDMADELIGVAAARSVKRTDKIPLPAGIYDEFAARFPYTETDDQLQAINSVLDDLASGQPSDRLVCGDVGFGKTEVALRAGFAAAYDGKQVAVVVPTTLLCRQHFHVFSERFKGYPMRIEQISRLVSPAHVRDIKEDMKFGTVDIVIGTHALLAKDVRFKNLGLLIVDEEQHFGVAHKERLKRLRADVHVLTLTATPIPRTLQLALTGIRDMSLIATPPVDRLAVRTFVLPFDPVVVREALMREKYRGGQSFYVCPRVADIPRLEGRLKELVPDLKFSVVHGRLPTKDLEATIAAFDEGAFDVLLSTNIIESGLDFPAVNTIIIHRADMFGLGQLYQLRGRVGRSKTRAYAYLTLPEKQKLTKKAEQRLNVMQTLDSLGAGFSLASHDLDIRGAGNLLGDEQSGHIREVGAELYQQMLEEAVAEARGLQTETDDKDWSPQIAVGLPVLIPDHYVADLTVRMGLYRRLAWLNTRAELDAFAAELIDRFGPLPEEAENLMQVMALKANCRKAGIAKVDAGPKGGVITFRNDDFANPAGLVDFLTKQAGTAKLRPDHRLVYMRQWKTPEERLEGVRYLVGELVRIAES